MIRRLAAALTAAAAALGSVAVVSEVSASASIRSTGPFSGMVVRRGDVGECQYRPNQLIARSGMAPRIARVLGTDVVELAALVPRKLAGVAFPPNVDRLSLYAVGGIDPLTAAIALDQQGLSAAPNYISSFAPGVRTWAPGEDAKPSAGPTAPPADPTTGAGLRIGVLDTGLNRGLDKVLPGGGSVTFVSAASRRFEMAALNLVSPGYVQPTELTVGRAAGHGTFIAGLVRRAAPAATLVVAQVPFYDGNDASFNVDSQPLFADDHSSRVDDAALTYMAYATFLAGNGTVSIDALSLSFGSYGCNTGIEPDAGEGDFRTPIGLRNALLDLWELSGRRLLVAAAAGNDLTDEPFYPAAFAANECFDPATLPAAAPLTCSDLPSAVSPWLGGVSSPPSASGKYSNVAAWAEVTAQGSDVISLGANLSWMSWSGTSFAAPCAAVIGVLKSAVWSDFRGALIDCGLDY